MICDLVTPNMAASIKWLPRPAELNLTDSELHIWRASLRLDAAVLRRLEAHLSPGERSRAERFHFDRDRDRYVGARGILRELLGSYLSQDPAELELSYGPQGKPAVRNNDPQKRIQFNLSHSHDLAVYAFARNRELGIDLEPIQPEFADGNIAERHFSARELDEWDRLIPELRAEAFFLCWTRKEAYVKARGEGLQIPLASFSVTLTPGQPEELHSTDSARWQLHSFQPAPGYAAAVVGEGKDWRLLQWGWTP
jgi:4'-phosphopantetheinyl transferase